MALNDEFGQLFSSGEVFSASDEILENVLKRVSYLSLANYKDDVVLTVLIVNSIRSQRHIDKIEKRNQIYTYIIIALSIAAIIGQLLPLILWKKI